MKASKFTDAQKAFILKQGADGHPVAEICRRNYGATPLNYRTVATYTIRPNKTDHALAITRLIFTRWPWPHNLQNRNSINA
jgi:hypothetical protein